MTRSRMFGVLLLVLPLLLALAAPLRAQAPAAPTAPAAAPVSVDELQRLVDTLQDDKERAKLVTQLQALIAAQRGEQKPEAEAPAAWLNQFSAEIDAISSEIVATAAVVLDAPSLFAWIDQEVSDAHSRARWLGISLKLGIVFGVAALGEWLLRLLMRRPQARLAARSTNADAAWAQALQLSLVLILETLPVFAFAGIAYFVLPLVQPRFTSSHVAEVIIQASLTARLILAVANVTLLSPAAASVYPLGDETRNYLYIWARRFTNWAVYGMAVASAAWWMGVPGAVYALLLRGTMLVLGVFAVIFVLQNRVAVADMLRGKKESAGAADHGGGHAWRVLRQRLADTWHVVAILYIVTTFGSYVLRIEGGFAYVFRATLLSLIVLAAAGIIVRAVKRLSQRGFAIGEDLKRRFPGLETRANRYLPVLTVVASIIVYLFAVLSLLQAWGFNAFAWFDTPAGRKITGALLSIATVLVTALIIWELFGSAIERYLNGTAANGHRMARSARARTLLPLLRTTVLIMLVTIVGLIILSEIGVNIAPLLAGAGVAGIAIGFGSQALVKDVITGLFILLEDTLAVGEVVDVGKDHSGIVEAISIRAIKLRDMAGTLHTVPFSEVSTVRNLTRDYSYFVADIGVLYREDPDRVIAVLQQVADELRRDPDWSASIVEPLEIFGVDRFTDTAMVIRARVKTVPLRQWAVGREFYRRMKKAFDAHGIEMPAGNQTRYLEAVPRAG